METALAGLGPTCRAFYWCSDPSVPRGPLPQELMHSFRERMCDCTGVSPTAPVQVMLPSCCARPGYLIRVPPVEASQVARGCGRGQKERGRGAGPKSGPKAASQGTKTRSRQGEGGDRKTESCRMQLPSDCLGLKSLPTISKPEFPD